MNNINRRKINLPKALRLFLITMLLVGAMTVTIKTQANGSTTAKYEVVTVCPGDTLWEIAKAYKGEENIQKVIYEIMKFNNMERADIYVGQKINIPIKY